MNKKTRSILDKAYRKYACWDFYNKPNPNEGNAVIREEILDDLSEVLKKAGLKMSLTPIQK